MVKTFIIKNIVKLAKDNGLPEGYFRINDGIKDMCCFTDGYRAFFLNDNFGFDMVDKDNKYYFSLTSIMNKDVPSKTFLYNIDLEKLYSCKTNEFYINKSIINKELLVDACKILDTNICYIDPNKNSSVLIKNKDGEFCIIMNMSLV